MQEGTQPYRSLHRSAIQPANITATHTIPPQISANLAPGIPSNAGLLNLWLGLRIFTIGWVLLFATIRPITTTEQSIPLWPPSQPYDKWVERVLAAPWERYDANYFAAAVRDGWDPKDGTTQFHPLFPLLAKPLALLLSGPTMALLLVASVAAFMALLAIYRLSRMDLPEDAAKLACIVFLAFPPSMIVFAPYTEGLWIASAALALLWSRQERWLLAAAAVAAATLTRQQGIVLILPVAWEVWISHRRNFRNVIRNPGAGAAILSAPVTYCGWILWRTFVLSDSAADLSSAQSFIYSTLLSASSQSVIPGQAVLLPWEALSRALTITLSSPGLSNILNLLLTAVFVFLTVLAWRWLRTSYRIFTISILLLSLSYYTGPVIPYMGLPRHVLLAFPVFIGLASVLQHSKGRGPVTAVFFTANLGFLALYTLEAWVP